MYVCVHAWMYVWLHGTCREVCTHACMNVCMYGVVVVAKVAVVKCVYACVHALCGSRSGMGACIRTVTISARTNVYHVVEWYDPLVCASHSPAPRCFFGSAHVAPTFLTRLCCCAGCGTARRRITQWRVPADVPHQDVRIQCDAVCLHSSTRSVQQRRWPRRRSTGWHRR